MSNDIIVLQTTDRQDFPSKDYINWRKETISLIEQSKLKAILSVNAELLILYWKIGNDILTKQKEQGWGAKVITQLSKDLTKRFPDDKGYSKRNLRDIRKAALAELPRDENELKMWLPHCRKSKSLKICWRRKKNEVYPIKHIEL